MTGIVEHDERAVMETRQRRIGRWLRALGACLFAGLLAAVPAPDAGAEYGDVVINNYSDAAGMRPVVFPHWFHRVRYACKVCHADLGFEFKTGGNQINMLKIIDGQYCGACHNGEIAWAIENCNLCHSAKPRTPTMVHESTTQGLAAQGRPAPSAARAAAKGQP